jgi:hypothetical protein
MVIPLTPEALILREKKNKRKTKTMINNIKNTMCRLADLTQEQIDSLQKEMPYGQFDFRHNEPYIGVTKAGGWGTWEGAHYPAIKTYAGMMQLLKGKDMNKQTAQEQMAVMQIEMDKLKAIIDKPEAKTGRVLCMDDLERNARYWYVWNSVKSSRMDYDGTDNSRIDAGNAFHDEQSAERHLEYLKLEQELRRAQIADGEATGDERYDVILNCKDGKLHSPKALVFHEKISFNTVEARDRFRSTHTDEQLTLLIRGV